MSEVDMFERAKLIADLLRQFGRYKELIPKVRTAIQAARAGDWKQFAFILAELIADAAQLSGRPVLVGVGPGDLPEDVRVDLDHLEKLDL